MKGRSRERPGHEASVDAGRWGRVGPAAAQPLPEMKLQSSCDVVVIGAGPAGSSAAALLRKAGLVPVVLEKQFFPRFVIGESLLPRCMDLLAEADLLGVAEAEGYAVKRGALFLRGAERCDFSFADQFTRGWDYTWQVPRADFDKTLADAVALRGVPFHYGCEVQAVDLSGTPKVTVVDREGRRREISARFVVDASGYGRVLPRLIALDEPSGLPPRKAVFAHVRSDRRPPGLDSTRIWIIVSSLPGGGWLWIIPFSNGLTSVGIVGDSTVFAQLPEDPEACLREVIDSEPNCARLRGGEWALAPRALSSYSCSVKRLHGGGFCLVGNATEFLDPVFSSGVTLALESANRASKCLIRQLSGQLVDWEEDYAKPMALGTDVFRTFVTNWYSGLLPSIIFSGRMSETIKHKICSVLAGYVWDTANPFVRDHRQKLAQLRRLATVSA
jgi:flavin-dependent dehydrogenase